jgi:adenylate cyclase
VRHLIHPFKPGDKLKDHAIPISDVIQQLQAQLAEFAALKQQLGMESVEAPRLAVPMTVNGLT